jgi:hypothetical protein
LGNIEIKDPVFISKLLQTGRIKSSVASYACNISYSGVTGKRILSLNQYGQKVPVQPISKTNKQTKRAGGVVQVVEHLPSVQSAIPEIKKNGRTTVDSGITFVT